MQYLCYGTKCSKQQEILLIFHTKKYKKIINRLKMENFRQKTLKMIQFGAILYQRLLIESMTIIILIIIFPQNPVSVKNLSCINFPTMENKTHKTKYQLFNNYHHKTQGVDLLTP
ncbi:hypothetical protein AT238_03120 [Bartonella henselae]|nr:hypothetical protein AT238_03120 [Bartonella henselae]